MRMGTSRRRAWSAGPAKRRRRMRVGRAAVGRSRPKRSLAGAEAAESGGVLESISDKALTRSIVERAPLASGEVAIVAIPATVPRRFGAALAFLVAAACLLSAAGCAGAPPRPADPAFHLDLPRLGGGRGRLSELRGKVVVLNFFATWCLPCVAEVPLFNRLARDYAADGLAVVGVSMDEAGPEAVALFVDRFEVAYPVWLADEKVLRGESEFGAIVGIPATFVLDREGRLVAAEVGLLHPRAFEAFLKRVLAGEIEARAAR
ncbi:MAG: TlpA family protein disulfide reductase [Deltaproteobacteria bacterium]|nr:MAG: TlpA family protein disulfide reductase [Deltaproteobacteria bacterium]